MHTPPATPSPAGESSHPDGGFSIIWGYSHGKRPLSCHGPRSMTFYTTYRQFGVPVRTELVLNNHILLLEYWSYSVHFEDRSGPLWFPAAYSYQWLRSECRQPGL